MALITKAIRGTQDLLPNESYKQQYIEKQMLETAFNFGYKEIRTPVFEHTELFQRGVGDTTDVVQKEMYTFNDKGNRSITLRPEGTAGAVRSFLEHGLYNEPLPQKVCYLTSCYRYEKPQAGRLREFHQFGVECLGAAEPVADAELISLAQNIFDILQINNLHLEINSIGCPQCRQKYYDALKEYFKKYENELCETCRGRMERNPMRILDCKSPVCSGIAKDAPTILDYLCDDCKEHFEAVKGYLDIMEIPYTINPRIVRGLDYYTRTVFEFVSDEIGAQGTVCGGGRYDGLVEELGGSHIPSLGFAMGLERLMLLMEAQGTPFPEEQRPDLFIATMGEVATKKALALANELRYDGASVLYDIAGRSLKAQMKYANKLNAQYSMVLGEDEIVKGKATVKNMDTGDQEEISLEDFSENFMRMSINESMKDLQNTMGDGQGVDLSSLFGGMM
ncbi:MAG: histidine--tRNA ligase [Clostridiales bacterium]|nr:histidine--tRNA ligase [Clostridiales bacterium]